MAQIIARWSIELEIECPRCEEFVNLLDYEDFWHDHAGEFALMEHGTAGSKDVEVVCPECRATLKVDLDY